MLNAARTKRAHAHWHICLPLNPAAHPKQAKEPIFATLDIQTKGQ